MPPTFENSRLDWNVVNSETAKWVTDYLNLSVPLEDLYDEWAATDPVFARFAMKFRGVRMLRQDPWECLCSFICSSNNNIARIGQMVQNLCTHYSPKLLTHTYHGHAVFAEYAAEPPLAMAIDYYPFPKPESLARPEVEEELRSLGFGYRAKYLHQTAKLLCETYAKSPKARAKLDPVPVANSNVAAVFHESRQAQVGRSTRSLDDSEDAILIKIEQEDPKGLGDAEVIPTPISISGQAVHQYLSSLRSMTYHAAREQLLKFQGVGPKVADCILLMSMDQPSSIPVDRHVFQIAAKWYGLRNAKYEYLAEYFREKWGEYAGWAHTVLFTADLRAFKGYDGGTKKEKEEVKTRDQPEWKSEPTEWESSLSNNGEVIVPPIKTSEVPPFAQTQELDVREVKKVKCEPFEKSRVELSCRTARIKIARGSRSQRSRAEDPRMSSKVSVAASNVQLVPHCMSRETTVAVTVGNDTQTELTVSIADRIKTRRRRK